MGKRRSGGKPPTPATGSARLIDVHLHMGTEILIGGAGYAVLMARGGVPLPSPFVMTPTGVVTTERALNRTVVRLGNLAGTAAGEIVPRALDFPLIMTSTAGGGVPRDMVVGRYIAGISFGGAASPPDGVDVGFICAGSDDGLTLAGALTSGSLSGWGVLMRSGVVRWYVRAEGGSAIEELTLTNWGSATLAHVVELRHLQPRSGGYARVQLWIDDVLQLERPFDGVAMPGHTVNNHRIGSILRAYGHATNSTPLYVHSWRHIVGPDEAGTY